MNHVSRRRSDSIILIGFFLGPFALMLWLGQGRLALLYLLAQISVISLVIAVVAMGLVAPPALGLGLVITVLTLPLHIVGIYHAFRIREAALHRPWYSRWYAVIILPVAASWILALAVREYLFQPFTAPSTSMVPGLMVGDYFFVSKSAYGQPQRGDIVVFNLPRDPEVDYVKRVIGLPGDRIQMKDGIVHLNGEALPLTRAQGIPCVDGERCSFFREALPDGRSYVINNATPNGPADNTDEVVVPEGRYFMLGDNRDNSLDSRFGEPYGIGYIPYENLVGPVTLIYWNWMGLRIDDRLIGYPGR